MYKINGNTIIKNHTDIYDELLGPGNVWSLVADYQLRACRLS